MGNIEKSSKKTNTPRKHTDSTSDNSGFFIKDSYSTNSGIISFKSSKDTLEQSISIENNFESSMNNSKDLIPHTFIWKEGGTKVALIASFSDWKIEYPMSAKHKSDEFSVEIVSHIYIIFLFYLNFLLFNFDSLYLEEFIIISLS